MSRVQVRKAYTSSPDFTPANAAKASSAAEGLCKWVHAMDSYESVAKVVAPKKLDLARADAAYEAIKAGLTEKQAQLDELLQRLEGMENQLGMSLEVCEATVA